MLGASICPTIKIPDWFLTSGASDSDFYYPAGYRIWQIVKENPAGYHNIRFLITIINKPFSVFVQDYCSHA